MKNLQLLTFLVCVSAALYGAEQKQIELWKNINCAEIKKTLQNDYKLYIKNRLEEYKKTDFSCDTMNDIENMGPRFIGKPLRCSPVEYNPSRYFDNVKDEDQNTLTHIAIIKADPSVLRWLAGWPKYLAYNANKAGKEPIDLCIDQLLPSAVEANKSVAHDMLDVLTAEYEKTYSFSLDYRKKFLQKMLALQLEHKKHNTGFILKDVLFTRFLKNNKDAQPDIVLSDIYQEVMDENKNTFTHVLVQQNLPDELYDLIKKEYITFTKNAEEKTPVDLALEAFRKFTQNSQLIDANRDEFNKSRCCLFMLLNYIKAKDNADNIVQCCDKHTIEKEKK